MEDEEKRVEAARKVSDKLFDTEHMDKLSEMRNLPVVMHNDLIQRNLYELKKNAGQGLSATESKILSVLLSRVKKSDKELRLQEFSIKEFCELCGIYVESGKNYNRIKDAILSLSKKAMWLKLDDSRETIVRWIEDVTLNKGSGTLLIQLDRKLTPYLIGLSGDFTMYPIHDILSMTGQYSIALYKLLRSHAFKGKHLKLTIEEFRNYLDCHKQGYGNITNLRNRVIEPAVSEINSYSELRVRYKLIKTGRSYTDIEFFVQNLRLSTSQEDLMEYEARYDAVEQELFAADIATAKRAAYEDYYPAFYAVKDEPGEDEESLVEVVIPGQMAIFDDDSAEDQ